MYLLVSLHWENYGAQESTVNRRICDRWRGLFEEVDPGLTWLDESTSVHPGAPVLDSLNSAQSFIPDLAVRGRSQQGGTERRQPAL